MTKEITQKYVNSLLQDLTNCVDRLLVENRLLKEAGRHPGLEPYEALSPWTSAGTYDRFASRRPQSLAHQSGTFMTENEFEMQVRSPALESPMSGSSKFEEKMRSPSSIERKSFKPDGDSKFQQKALQEETWKVPALDDMWTEANCAIMHETTDSSFAESNCPSEKAYDTLPFTNGFEEVQAPRYRSVAQCRRSSYNVGSQSAEPVGSFGKSSIISHMRLEDSDKTAEGLEQVEVMPDWFNPDDEHWNRTATLKLSNRSGNLPDILQDDVLHDGSSFCVLAPMGSVRLTWDILWCVFLAYEIWILALEIVYFEHGFTPDELVTLSRVSLGFFCSDIVLNFFTGYVDEDAKREVFRHILIIKHYLKFWFWFDLVATVPWDEILKSDETDSLSSTRAAKAGKAYRMLKISKLFRVAKVFRHVKTAKQVRVRRIIDNVKRVTTKNGVQGFRASMTRTLLEPLRNFDGGPFLSLAFQVFLALITAAHIHGVVWGSLHPDWSPSKVPREAFDRYFESFWWAFSQLTFGNAPWATRWELWVLDLVIYFERVMMCVWLFRQILFEALVLREADARFSLKGKESLAYLQAHNVSVKMQCQVLQTLQDTGAQRKRMQWFTELVSSDLPLELQKAINEELWSEKLLTLGLTMTLSESHPDFVLKLSQEVREESYASSVIVCKEGDVADAAYHILHGGLEVHSYIFKGKIPPFTKGMWVGEKAFINPELRRSATVFTKCTSTLMVVPADSYMLLLNKLGLMDFFQEYCATELWKGLCGRCGMVGDHWGSDCPFVNESGEYVTGKKIFGRFKAAGTVLQEEYNGVRQMPSLTSEDGQPAIHKDLRMFLAHHRLESVAPALIEMDVLTLQALEQRHDEVRESLEARIEEDATLALKHRDLAKFSEEQVRLFIEGMSKMMTRRMMASNIPADHHFMFLSHYKLEAGTEAALLRAELEQLMATDVRFEKLFQNVNVPIYLDSENLSDLHDLMQEVSRSHNLVLMCTKGVLYRPWCILEIVTAAREQINVIIVNIMKAGCEFEMPSEDYFTNLKNGTVLGEKGTDLIIQNGFDMDDVCIILKRVFKRILLPYSPHRPMAIRKAEVQALLKQSQTRQAQRSAEENNEVVLNKAARKGSLFLLGSAVPESMFAPAQREQL